jgi:N utilization substance protein A
MEVIVAEDQLSLAIGKRGQNVRLAGKLVGWNLDIKSEAEKKAEIEADMERMAAAAEELGSLPGIDEKTTTCLLDAGFLTVEEVSLASMEDLTTIPGIDEETAIELHDSAEAAFEQQLKMAAEEAAAAEAEAAEETETTDEETGNESGESDPEEETQPTDGGFVLDANSILAADDALSAEASSGESSDELLVAAQDDNTAARSADTEPEDEDRKAE